LCHERGLTPFLEAYPLITDYVRKDGSRVHGISVKEHYSVAERWSQQCGGYTIRLREIRRDQDGIYARIGIVSNRDYAAVGQLCARVPGLDFKEELAGFMTIGEAVLTADEMGKKPAPKGKTWEWLAEKRARESAILQKFGREPSQSRQIYTAALANNPQAAAALLYGEAPALPAPITPSVSEGEVVETVPAPQVPVTPAQEASPETQTPAPTQAPQVVQAPDPAPAAQKQNGNGKRNWQFSVLQAILKAQLSDNSYSAKAALNLSNLSADVTPDEAVAWMRVYRAERDGGKNPQEAAQVANSR
jgi:hypothetical protein